ncbi:MAG: hypothetical protein JWR50_2840 [Mucilaginibacter sp.]|nr:hypothetical protein [Mucilaginibacter sp.]
MAGGVSLTQPSPKERALYSGVNIEQKYKYANQNPLLWRGQGEATNDQ